MKCIKSVWSCHLYFRRKASHRNKSSRGRIARRITNDLYTFLLTQSTLSRVKGIKKKNPLHTYSKGERRSLQATTPHSSFDPEIVRSLFLYFPLWVNKICIRFRCTKISHWGRGTSLFMKNKTTKQNKQNLSKTGTQFITPAVLVSC